MVLIHLTVTEKWRADQINNSSLLPNQQRLAFMIWSRFLCRIYRRPSLTFKEIKGLLLNWKTWFGQIVFDMIALELNESLLFWSHYMEVKSGSDVSAKHFAMSQSKSRRLAT